MQIYDSQNFQREPESVQIQNNSHNIFSRKKNNSNGDPSVILQIQHLAEKQKSNLKLEVPELDIDLFAAD